MNASGNFCRRFVIALLLLTAAVAVSSPVWFPRLGSFLVVADPLEKADIIEVLGGGDPQRAIVGAKLFKDGWAPRVVTTGELVPDYIEGLGEKITQAELTGKFLSLNGVPPRHITVLNVATSTFEEAEELRKFMEKNNMKSAIVVTSIFHTRRARMVFRKAFAGSSLKAIVRPAEGGKFTVDHWWTREEDMIFVNNEYVKLVLYLVKGKI